MANANAPFGLRPLRDKGGNYWSGGLTEYQIADQLAANIGTGDLVKKTGTGNFITKAANGDYAIGVFMGARWTLTDGSVFYRPYWPSGQQTFNAVGGFALVVDDPNVVFAIQSDATGIADTDIGQFAAVTVGANYDINGNSSTVATGPNGALSTLKLLRASPMFPTRNAAGAYRVVEVMIAKHELMNAYQAS